MLSLSLRAVLVTVVLVASSLVFADELVLSALILVTITLAAVALMLGPAVPEEAAGAGPHPGP